MEEKNATIMAATDIVDDMLVQNMSRFKEKIEASEIFALDNLRLEISNNDKYGTVDIPMKRQHLIVDVMNWFDETLNVNILYSLNTEKGRVWRVVAYSKPCHDEMYIVGLKSEMYGIMEQMTVTFFNSIDVMFSWLRDNLDSMQSYKGVFLYKQEVTELYRIFM